MAERRRSSSRSGGSGGNAGCIVWLILLCVVLLLFLLNWGKIQETLERTNFHEIVKTERDSGGKPAAPKPEEPAPAARPGGGGDSAAEEPGVAVRPPEPRPDPAAEPESQAQSAKEPAAEPQAKPGAKTAEPADKPASGKPAGAGPAAAAKPARSRAATLYFVRIDDDGVIVRQEVKRQIPATDSPLTDSLAALLGGPSDEELRRKLMSLVPQGTKLLSAQVRGSTAYLNFSEAFMYNHYGIEGYAGQLKQVVYTATAFSTVQDVQILIEGERHDYLGGEGVYIGKPLSRNSF